jgi:opacity protein-like surface antigen
MFKKQAIVSVVLAAMSSASFAGSFDGWFVQGGALFANNKTTITEDTTANVNGSYTKSDVVAQIAAGYSHDFGNFNLAGSISYAADSEAGDHVVRSTFPFATIHFKQKDNLKISVEPGIYLSKEALLYAKVSYAQANLEATETGTTPDSQSHTVTGYGYGAGIKYLFTPNLYAVAEIEQTNYAKKAFFTTGSKLEDSQLGTFVGVGYKF